MALPVPNLPTDNLYKFLSLFGLVLLLLAIGLPSWAWYQVGLSQVEPLVDVRLKLAEIHSSVERYKLQLEDVAGQINRVRDSLAQIKQNSSASMPSVPQFSTEQLENATRQLQSDAEDWRELDRGVRLLVIGGYHREMLRQSLWVAVPTGVLGLALLMIGFTLWFTRLQRYLDRSVRKQAEQ